MMCRLKILSDNELTNEYPAAAPRGAGRRRPRCRHLPVCFAAGARGYLAATAFFCVASETITSARKLSGIEMMPGCPSLCQASAAVFP